MCSYTYLKHSDTKSIIRQILRFLSSFLILFTGAFPVATPWTESLLTLVPLQVQDCVSVPGLLYLD